MSQIISAFMEPQPDLFNGAELSPRGWWVCVCAYLDGDQPMWCPRYLSNSELTEVQAEIVRRFGARLRPRSARVADLEAAILEVGGVKSAPPRVSPK